MSVYRIKLNQDRCINCKACLVHCKAKNQVPQGLALNRLEVEGPVDKDGVPRFVYKYTPCLHCKKPKCVPACPTGAIKVREKDGIVYIDQELCIGCGECVEACPWDVPVLDTETGKAMKCDLCMDRIDKGLLPACITGCTAKALELVMGKQKAEAGLPPQAV